jgi:hypothetical protein
VWSPPLSLKTAAKNRPIFSRGFFTHLLHCKNYNTAQFQSKLHLFCTGKLHAQPAAGGG